MSTLEKVLFITIYYACWFAGVFSAAYGYAWLALAVFLPISLVQMLWMRRYFKACMPFLIVFTVAGIIVDSVLALTGFISFNANPWPILIAPAWIMVIWLNFSVVYLSCMQFLFHRYAIISVLALVGFPVAYIAGARLGAATFNYGLLSGLLLGVIWAILLPLLNALYLYHLPKSE